MVRWIIAVALLAAGALGCRGSDAPFARAQQVQNLTEGIGGPVASGRVGDFLLENDQLRAIIEQGGSSRLPLDVGGSLVDLDLQRPEDAFRGGRGLDQLGQIAPVGNLYIARATVEKNLRLTRTTDGAAEVTVVADSAPIQKILGALGLVLLRDFLGASGDHSEFRMYTEYRLQPGERLLRMRTSIGFDVPFCRAQPSDGCNAECDDILYDSDCSCPAVPARCTAGATELTASLLPDRPEPMGLSDLILGDLPRPLGSGQCAGPGDCGAGETCVPLTTSLGGESRVCRPTAGRSAGVFLGDMLLYGGHLRLFIPGTGYDTESDIRRLFDSGEDTLSMPLKLEAVYALGDRVSYGYSTPEAYTDAQGKVLVPIFGGPFSMGATAAVSCQQDQPGCLSQKVIRTERWVSVGSGDPDSAREPLLLAAGQALGEVKGLVRWTHRGTPVEGAQVFAFEDPRRGCAGACPPGCTDLSGVTDQEISTWSAEQVISANRCLTVGAPFLDGHAGIDTMARTDPGTDPLIDGTFRLALRPGRYLLIAQSGEQLSGPVPAEVVAGETVELSLALTEPGRLQYALFDEQGRPSAGRVIVGQCFSTGHCRDDADCGGEQTCVEGSCACPRRSGRPLELGGARLTDGVLAHGQTGSGQGTLELPAGEYEVRFSRGPHRGIFDTRVSIAPNQSVQVMASVPRQVDREGWAAADFHVHAGQSIDSGLDMGERVRSFLAEDLDFLSSSDHDVLSQYEPLLESLNARTRLSTQVGVEVTTQELGHFLGYPLKYQEWEGGTRVLGNGAPEWRQRTPGQIFRAIREAGLPGTTPVVEVPHFYTYFDSYAVHPFSVEPQETIISLLLNPLVAPENFSGDFDVLELMNGKGFDQIRRPTVGDVRFHSQGLDALLARRRTGELDAAAFQRAAYNHAAESTRRILHRTQTEQAALVTGVGATLDCRCGSDGDCSAGLVCDQATLGCVAPPASSATPASDDALCSGLRGMVDDWFQLLNRGVRRTGVAGSDVHDLVGYEPGSPRTMLPLGPVSPPGLSSAEVTQALLAGHAVVTNGPMVRFEVNGAGVGQTVEIGSGAEVTLAIRVETPAWYDVDRIEVFRNGELIHWVSGCASRRSGDVPEPHGHACLQANASGPAAHRLELTDAPSTDAWYVVTAAGLDGRSLSPTYASAALARLGTFEITQRIYDLVPRLSTLRTPRFPSLYPTIPYAVTNPIYVVVGGGEWTAPLPPPSWCVPGRDVGCPN